MSSRSLSWESHAVSLISGRQFHGDGSGGISRGSVLSVTYIAYCGEAGNKHQADGMSSWGYV